MEYSSSARARVARFISIVFAAALFAGSISSSVTQAQSAKTAAASAAPHLSTEELVKRKTWGAAIARTPAPKKGCFTASYQIGRAHV